jgi:hypothetical protein
VEGLSVCPKVTFWLTEATPSKVSQWSKVKKELRIGEIPVEEIRIG